MHLHSNATTTHVTRRLIQQATGSIANIARLYGVSWTTAKRWHFRQDVEDRSSRPKTLHTAIPEPIQELLLELRRRSMSLDEVFESVMDEHPCLGRSSLWRLFRRHGMGRLKKPTRQAHSTFKPYPPGYVHIDSFNTPRFGSTRYYGFVAIDRATRRTHVAVYSDKTQASGADFLRQCVRAFEFRIKKVLTDNGSEFTNRAYKGGRARRVHEFDQVCRLEGIEHRFTKPRTPKTNGLAERQVQIIKNATTRKNTYLSPEVMKQDIRHWDQRNNAKRQRRLAYKTPIQVSQEWYDIDEQLFRRKPGSLAA
jgi:transposase InsO family protein